VEEVVEVVVFFHGRPDTRRIAMLLATLLTAWPEVLASLH
jgi:hypothetical protein